MTSRALLLALALAGCNGALSAAEEKAAAAKREADRQAITAAWKHDEVKPPADREPTYKPGEDMANKPENVAKADAAERAVYARCSKFPAFREGSTIDATYVPPMGGKRTFELVNVSVKLADPSKAQGNTLWYEVDFEGGKPSTIAGQKQISSVMCGLGEGPMPL